MAEIAARVGIRKASLYNHYRSKEELLTGLLEESVEAWGAAADPLLGGAGSLHDRLLRHFEGAVAFAVRETDKVAVVWLAATQIGGELGRRMRGYFERQSELYVERMQEEMKGALERGEVADGDPGDLALYWKAFLDGVLLELVIPTTNGRRLEPTHLRQLFALVWRGIAGAAVASPQG
jgi:AcrR family transcriptional regulator